VIELAKHIEVLLLSNDCVTIPGFGGFVAHYIPARIDETDGVFLPPMRAIGFNPQLKLNDSLLVQSYVEVYDISYPEALRRVEEEVIAIQDTISREGSYVLENIGTLTANEEGGIRFAPAESGILTPSLYGLGTLEFPMLNAPATLSCAVTEGNSADARTVAVVTPTEDEGNDVAEEDDEERALTIRMSWVRNAMAVAAAIVLFFLMSTPVVNSDFGSPEQGILSTNTLYKLLPKDTNTVPATPVAKKQEAPMATSPLPSGGAGGGSLPSESNKQDSPAATSPLPSGGVGGGSLPSGGVGGGSSSAGIGGGSEAAPYCLCLASQVKRSNAEEFARQLRARGHKDVEVYIHNNVVRVVYGHFKSESAAYAALSNLQAEDDFEEAWVYKRKAGA